MEYLTCTKCAGRKLEDEFNWKQINIRRSTICKTCHKAYRAQHYLDNKQKYIDKARAWEVAQGGRRYIRYGIEAEVEKAMFAEFDGSCWLCRRHPATVIDHDHSCCPGTKGCGKCVRGALCHTCNVGIGLFGDDLESLRRAVDYLSRPRV